MKWEKNIRETGLVEWICECGIGHPDEESATIVAKRFGHNKKTWLIHGCCGHCSRKDFPGRKRDV